jgi:uncharacterized protein (TIGR02271 family)
MSIQADARDKNHDGHVSATEKAFDKGTHVDRNQDGFDDRDRNHDGKVSFGEKVKNVFSGNKDKDRDGFDDRDRNRDGQLSGTERHDKNFDGVDDRDKNMDGHVSMGEKIKGAFTGNKTSAGTTTHDTMGTHTGMNTGHTTGMNTGYTGMNTGHTTGQDYCTDLRCHGYMPCREHSQIGAHHHHGGVTGGEVNKMSLSEERLAANKTQIANGGIDLHKRVETEHVREQVPLRREEVVVERRPITGAGVSAMPASGVDGHIIENKDAHVRVPLMREELVTQKVLVPKEEIIVHKKEMVDNKVVEADLRREHLETARLPASTHPTTGTGFSDSRDLNRDGHVSMGEKAAARGTGYSGSDPRDLNHDGHVSMGEKAAAGAQPGVAHDPRDLNKDGHVSAAEGGHDARDTNHDGHVSLKEKIKDKLHIGRHHNDNQS